MIHKIKPIYRFAEVLPKITSEASNFKNMIGSFNTLQVVKRVAFGLYLDGEEMGEILLPNRYVPDNAQIGDYLTVFVYTDGEDRPIATTAQPLAVVGDFAFMQVKSIASVGAFLEWGIMKDLLVPYSEQTVSLRTGQKVLVYVYLDNKTKRVVASAKWETPFEIDGFLLVCLYVYVSSYHKCDLLFF